MMCNDWCCYWRVGQRVVVRSEVSSCGRRSLLASCTMWTHVNTRCLALAFVGFVAFVGIGVLMTGKVMISNYLLLPAFHSSLLLSLYPIAFSVFVYMCVRVCLFSLPLHPHPSLSPFFTLPLPSLSPSLCPSPSLSPPPPAFPSPCPSLWYLFLLSFRVSLRPHLCHRSPALYWCQ